MSMKEKRFGLIGAKLGHSHSPLIHAQLAPYRYDLYEIAETDLAGFVRRPGWGGLNVTIPYKKSVIPLCDRLSHEAQAIGSVNTLVYEADGSITGHNTDLAGFTATARRADISFAEKKVLIFGSGGTSLTAAHAARTSGAKEVVVISRRGEDNYQNLDRHADAQIVVNTTPVGMHPDNAGQIADLSQFFGICGAIDVVYNPLRTRLVQQARDLGVPSACGLPMLVWQAAKAAELFLGAPVDESQAEAALKMLESAVSSIVLIGMPGCGKSAVGRELARLTGRELIDTDELVEQKNGRGVPAIIESDGEPAFRKLERKAVACASARTGCIISTGGGAVLDEENRQALAQNGRIYLLERPLELLDVAGRPLSTNLEAIWRERWPVYRAFCDRIIDNSDTIERASKSILEDF